ncbi:hypothetical protein LCGC14_0452080 [marine sediment metagenome]|uniref:Uncharacterized protein n=1 Tax=marine sediment metagenome TaxID=412755 RepID=A0A0F9T0S1_9ZZZZ
MKLFKRFEKPKWAGPIDSIPLLGGYCIQIFKRPKNRNWAKKPNLNWDESQTGIVRLK